MSKQMENLQAFLDEALFRSPGIRLLEAGCGSSSNLKFGGQVQLVGIDISEKQLERNTVLHERIAGDVQSYEFPAESFDGIVCWDVLEHLPHPDLALQQFSRAVKQGGFVILALPNVLSLKGLVTKFFPHSLHVLAYRYFWGIKDAGKNDTLPFRTYLRFCISAGAIRKQGERLGLKVVYSDTQDVAEGPWLRKKKPAFVSYVVLKKIVGLLSFGSIGNSDLIMVLTKVQPS
jgi:ubiquinone/menaquinone biosynthesis C-methylase UbiE